MADSQNDNTINNKDISGVSESQISHFLNVVKELAKPKLSEATQARIDHLSSVYF